MAITAKKPLGTWGSEDRQWNWPRVSRLTRDWSRFYKTLTTWPQPRHTYIIYRPIGLLPYNVQLQSAWANWRWTIFTKTITEEVCSTWHSNSLFRYFCRSKFVTFWSSLNLLITFNMVHYTWLVQHLYPNSGLTSPVFINKKLHKYATIPVLGKLTQIFYFSQTWKWSCNTHHPPPETLHIFIHIININY